MQIKVASGIINVRKKMAKVIDYSNYPQIVKFSSVESVNIIQLPRDVIISVNGKKVIAESKILDGGYITERILQEPMNIEFEFTCREVASNPGHDATQGNFNLKDSNYIFPAEYIKNIIENVWKVERIINVENTYLNNTFGILEIIIYEISEIMPIRGSNNVTMRILAKQNYYTSQNVTLIKP